MSTVPNVATGSQLRPPARMRLCTRGRAPVLLRREVPVAGMASLVGCHADRRQEGEVYRLDQLKQYSEVTLKRIRLGERR